jgi:hypothetical protein
MSRSKLNTFASTIILINFANIDGMANQDRQLVGCGITYETASELLQTLRRAQTACRNITDGAPQLNSVIAKAFEADIGPRKYIRQMPYLRLKKFMLLVLSGIDECVLWVGRHLVLFGRYDGIAAITGPDPTGAESLLHNKRVLRAVLACFWQMRLGYQCQLEAISDFFGRLAALLAHTTRERTEQTARWWELGAADE